MFTSAVRASVCILPFVLAGCGARPSAPTKAADGSAAYDAAPPARTRSTSSEWSVAGVVHGKSETSTSEPAAPAAAPPEVAPVRPQPSAQSGLLTAGDEDDLLNPEAYADYAGRFLQAAGGTLPFVDTRTRVAVKVVDAQGRPAPFATVAVSRPGAPLRLVAGADGVASFFPRFDRVPPRTTLSIASSAGHATRALDLGSGGARRVAVALPGQAGPVTAMDLTLVVDTTGSMGDEIAYLQAELDAIVARLRRESGNLDLRIGLIFYRDEGDEYVVRSAALTSDTHGVRAMLARQEASGGGDMPEAVDRAMLAAEAMQWRPGAAKALVLVGDAPPHADKLAATLASVERLRARGVQIVPVAASGVDDQAQYVMRTMAALTQGRYLFLTDDSGVGDAHAEPDVGCYLVTRLDGLIARVLAGLGQGRRIEPAPGEVVRTVGRYDHGRCLGAGRQPGQG